MKNIFSLFFFFWGQHIIQCHKWSILPGCCDLLDHGLGVLNVTLMVCCVRSWLHHHTMQHIFSIEKVAILLNAHSDKSTLLLVTSCCQMFLLLSPIASFFHFFVESFRFESSRTVPPFVTTFSTQKTATHITAAGMVL